MLISPYLRMRRLLAVGGDLVQLPAGEHEVEPVRPGGDAVVLVLVEVPEEGPELGGRLRRLHDGRHAARWTAWPSGRRPLKKTIQYCTNLMWKVGYESAVRSRKRPRFIDSLGEFKDTFL